MNAKQRNKNRKTADRLSDRLKKPFACPECGELTKDDHFVPPIFGSGFWICDKFYDKSTGMRINGDK